VTCKSGSSSGEGVFVRTEHPRQRLDALLCLLQQLLHFPLLTEYTDGGCILLLLLLLLLVVPPTTCGSESGNNSGRVLVSVQNHGCFLLLLLLLLLGPPATCGSDSDGSSSGKVF
jgi:hypothetical protein